MSKKELQDLRKFIKAHGVSSADSLIPDDETQTAGMVADKINGHLRGRAAFIASARVYDNSKQGVGMSLISYLVENSAKVVPFTFGMVGAVSFLVLVLAGLFGVTLPQDTFALLQNIVLVSLGSGASAVARGVETRAQSRAVARSQDAKPYPKKPSAI